MSSYRARVERRRLAKQLKGIAVKHRHELERVQAEASNQIYLAKHALARARYEQPVRWGNGDLQVRYENAPTTVVHAPRIDLRMFALRKTFDRRFLRTYLREQDRRIVEQDIALEIARALLKEGMVAIDEASETPMYPPQAGIAEFDFAVYVGKPVPRR